MSGRFNLVVDIYLVWFANDNVMPKLALKVANINKLSKTFGSYLGCEWRSSQTYSFSIQFVFD